MCNVCFKEFKGWCRSFTRTEAVLSILEGFLLVLLFGLLVFLILHFFACTNDDTGSDTVYYIETTTSNVTLNKIIVNVQPNVTPAVATKTLFSVVPNSECTWKPSEKTRAHIKYYEYNTTINKEFASKSTSAYNNKSESKPKIVNKDLEEAGEPTEVTMKIPLPYDYQDVTDFLSDESVGEEAEEFYQQYILALVKVNPPKDITFGCILTIVTEYWTITSASCIEAIEKVDSLDSFVMMEDYGRVRKGRNHVISDVKIHPMYEGVNKTYDLVALKSEDSLMKGSGYAVDLPSMVDYFMVTIGERFTLLGYGPYRTIDTGPVGKRLHKVYVYTLPSKQCVGEGSSWLRHLWGGAAAAAAPCGAAPLCAGALSARALPCNYCAGAPLLRAATLVGLMSDNQQCGVACDPQLYVNIAALRDWLYFVTATK